MNIETLKELNKHLSERCLKLEEENKELVIELSSMHDSFDLLDQKVNEMIEDAIEAVHRVNSIVYELRGLKNA